ncbi:MAG: GDP-mannose 4,6-dehydratase [Candidatus Eisenbacteria bacterium]|nr:GDP-mannose 4,6-dehydratase [Candidatus Eisenbacteria bacterium]
MRVLITGITGFAGSHLVDYILANVPGVQVFGIYRWRSRMENVEHLGDKVKMYECDIRDSSSVRFVIEEVKPDRIFHLAAQSFVPTSWLAPGESLSTNIIGQLNILEAVRKTGMKPRIQIAGSSEEYGLVHPNELPIRETNTLRPLSPYAVSKVAQDLMGFQYFMSYKMDIVRTRGFNHTGPRRPPVFVCSDIAKQISDIEKNRKAPEISLGNLDAKRDFTDVRDIVAGYWFSLEKGEPGEVYNICSGRSFSIGEIVELFRSIAEVKISIKHDETRMRPSDVPILVGDYGKFQKLTGWKPVIPFEQTLRDLLDFWRKR